MREAQARMRGFKRTLDNWMTVFVGGKMVVVTAQFLHTGPFFGRMYDTARASLPTGCCHLAKARTPEYVRTRRARNSVPLDDSEMPLLAHVLPPPLPLPPLPPLLLTTTGAVAEE